MAPLLLAPLIQIGGKLIDRLFPDEESKARAQLELLKMQQTGELAQMQADTSLALGQIEVNKAEAASGDRFSAGWRPLIGYVCAAGLIYTFLLQPLLPWIVALFGKTVPALPALETEALMALLFGMLGLGSLRSIEKVKGTK